MRRILFLSVLLVAQLSMAQTDKSVTSVRFLHLLQDGNGDSLHTLLDSGVKNRISAGQLALMWKQIEGGLGLGNFIDTAGYLYEYGTAYLGLEFEKGTLDLVLHYSDKDQITGFFVRPPHNKTPYRIPAYADTSAFLEIDYPLHREGTLPGKLCLPKGKGPFPLVILGHGSGPNSLDENMGPNRVFRDLAYGLASQGIAVYRFDKRTLVYGARIMEHYDSFTLWEETIHDLVYLADTFAGHPSILPSSIHVLGHSLAGLAAPRVAQQSKHVKSIILMGAPATPLDSLVLYQYTYLDSLDPSGTYYQALKNVREEVEYLRSDDFGPETGREWLPLQLPALYWMDLLAYDPVKTACNLDIRILVLQAKDDYQVPSPELQRWKEGLKACPARAFYLEFEGLGHGFFESEGIEGPAQYEKQHSVSPAVIQSIRNFIRP